VSAGRSRRAGAAAVVAAFVLTTHATSHAADAAESKAAACFACHGPNGNSTNPAVPSLAGQPAQFISTQLIMFREGRRKDPQMSPVAANLGNLEMNELGKYFSAQKPVPPARKIDSAKVEEGRRLTEKFNCVACHGAQLQGQQHIPRLVGQQPDYLRTQLRGFKAGTRFDMDGNMTAAAQPLSDRDIDVIVEYLAAAK
jgi:cytochrome c553